jgi:leader peptidase (prepilin peptidase)/N-methyltransferase
MNLLTCIFAFVVYACVGSFIGVCVDRIPRGEQIYKGRSHCDSCGRELKAWELIPILSYVLLGGRCKRCRKRIPVSSLLIELATSVLGPLAIIMYGLSVQGIAFSIITCILIEIAIVDYKTMEISDLASLMIAVIGIALMIYDGSYIPSLIGMVCVSLPFLVLALFKAMGFGDVKLMAAVGLLLGYKGVLLAAFFGIVIGSVAAAVMKIKNQKGWKSEIAFGPYLCVGTYISMLFGERLLTLYLSLLQ